MYFDSHAHLTCDAVYDDIEGVLERAKEAEVTHIANICTDPITLDRGLELAKQNSWLYNVGATTPHDVAKEGKSAFPRFEEAAKKGWLVAVGETGLDYHYEHSPKDMQREFLKRYIDLAHEVQLPLVIHCRDAFDDFFALTDKVEVPLILHCFTGTVDEAAEVIARGWYLSLSGIVTFNKSTVLKEVATLVPLDQLLIETDAPYLAPVPKRGKPNEPAYVVHTAAHIAELRDISADLLANATMANAKRAFAIANH